MTSPRAPARLAVLISGNGSNLQAVIDATQAGALPARVVLVVSNRREAYGLVRAACAGIPACAFPFKPYREAGRSRDAYDADLAGIVAGCKPDLVVLAGWMHVLSAAFLDRFPGRILNLHPALPGQFAGTHAIQRAHEAFQRGEITHTGVMVHWVVPEVDAGPVIVEAEVPICPDDTLEDLEARVHATEHRLLVDAIRRKSRTMTQRALLSVYDKTGLIELGQGLTRLGFELVASGGTARVLSRAGLPVTQVDQVTGFSEILGGRVKTLHPAVHGGILARRTPEHLAELSAHGIAPFDVVICNLYPFAATVSRPGVTEADAVEEIDIGGVTLLRAAAKNFESVAVVCDPGDYPAVVAALGSGGIGPDERRRLALKAFRYTATYDAAIATWLTGRVEIGQAFPSVLNLAAERVQTLRYGENPHQHGALYRWAGAPALFEQLLGKELSYNNIIDLDAAWAMPQEFAEPAVAIIKHTNPSGLATAASVVEAYRLALACDPVSAYGSIIATNREGGRDLVEEIGSLFVEVLVAPAYAPDALAWLAEHKKNCRVMLARPGGGDALVIRSVRGGLLVQTPDQVIADESAWRVVTRRAPTLEERRSLAFAWRAVKHVKSNAIVLAQGTATVGVGAGQMNRVDSVYLAARRAGERARDAVMGSDAFFPFADGIEAAAAAGVTACIQPGGSLRDDDAIAAADRTGMAMIFTGERHFRH